MPAATAALWLGTGCSPAPQPAAPHDAVSGPIALTAPAPEATPVTTFGERPSTTSVGAPPVTAGVAVSPGTPVPIAEVRAAIAERVGEVSSFSGRIVFEVTTPSASGEPSTTTHAFDANFASDGRTWLATDQGGWQSFDPATGTVRSVATDREGTLRYREERGFVDGREHLVRGTGYVPVVDVDQFGEPLSAVTGMADGRATWVLTSADTSGLTETSVIDQATGLTLERAVITQMGDRRTELRSRIEALTVGVDMPTDFPGVIPPGAVLSRRSSDFTQHRLPLAAALAQLGDVALPDGVDPTAPAVIEEHDTGSETMRTLVVKVGDGFGAKVLRVDAPPRDGAPEPELPADPLPAEIAASERADAGRLSTPLGCVESPSAASLDGFFARRVGPLVGADYQRVFALGDDRYLWTFQDAFVDFAGTAATLDHTEFVHNVAMLQTGLCFELLSGGTRERPEPFEPGVGANADTWFWPLGGQLLDGTLWMFWAEMVRDPQPAHPDDGVGWHPAGTWLATYDGDSLERLSFELAPNPGTAPIYGYSVESDTNHTYLFANTFEQNLEREGGYENGPHSGTRVYLARVPRGQLRAPYEYWTGERWHASADSALPVSERYWVENPMQPRWMEGRWVAVTKADGYWGDTVAVDVAPAPQGPWTTVEQQVVAPRTNDPRMNTYHAHLMPWLDDGDLVVSLSTNARDMPTDGWPHPYRYRPMFVTWERPWL